MKRPVSTSGDVDKIVFRKVSEAINRDDRFRSLSPIQPCGQGLFLHLLIGTHVTPLPGLSVVGRAAMAEELGWEIEDFDEAFAEVADTGLVKADWRARVVWLPNGLKHNLPANPNVVRGWGKYWERVPDCEIKIEAHEVMLRVLSDRMGEAFAKPFRDGCANPSAKGFGKGSANPLAKALGDPSANGYRKQRTESREQTTESFSPSQEGESLGVISPFTRVRPLLPTGGDR